ncbi:hypothetical protein [Floridanema aerugineum]|uniref:Uncharacterized protein n=1 Tax=Floridaenema aerugineum BLCC-F46 TaxID=3153654 RepID=A0ABV4X280_9CYAN
MCSLVNLAREYGIYLDAFTKKRLELLSYSKVLAVGIVNWDDRYNRYTQQVRDKNIVRFPDNSELHQQLMIDLDTFEFQAEESPDKALYCYTIGEDSELHFSIFSQPKQHLATAC